MKTINCPGCDGVIDATNAPSRFACPYCTAPLEIPATARIVGVPPKIESPFFTIKSKRKTYPWMWAVGAVILGLFLAKIFIGTRGRIEGGMLTAGSEVKIRVLSVSAGKQQISGEAVNESGRDFESVRIEFALYDGEAKVGDARARVYRLANGERWKFEAPVFRRYTKYSVQRIVCNGSEVKYEAPDGM